MSSILRSISDRHSIYCEPSQYSVFNLSAFLQDLNDILCLPHLSSFIIFLLSLYIVSSFLFLESFFDRAECSALLLLLVLISACTFPIFLLICLFIFNLRYLSSFTSLFQYLCPINSQFERLVQLPTSPCFRGQSFPLSLFAVWSPSPALTAVLSSNHPCSLSVLTNGTGVA